MTKLTLAALDALAFIHLTGREPKGTHTKTSLALLDHRTRNPFTLDGPWLSVNDDSLALIAKRPLVKAVALFEQHGFALPESYGDRIAKLGKRTQYVVLKRASDGVVVRLWKRGGSATVEVPTGRAHPSTEYVCLTGKHATPLPATITDAPAALTADEADLLDLIVDDGEAVARAVRRVVADDATPMQVEIVERLRGLKARGLPGLIRAFKGNAYGRAESVALTPEGHRALAFRERARRDDAALPHRAFMVLALSYRREAIVERVRQCGDPECTLHTCDEPDFDETVEEQADRLTGCTP